jgi:hypothetical protein
MMPLGSENTVQNNGLLLLRESNLVDFDGGEIYTSRVLIGERGKEGWERSLSEELLKMHTTVAEWRDVEGGEEIMNFESLRENPQLCSPL